MGAKMKELAIQKELCDAAEALDSRNFAYKQNNRFMVGVSDLFVKLHQYPVAIIEVKLVSPLDGRGPVAVDITKHQLRYLRRMREAGVVAGWVAVSPVSHDTSVFGSRRDARLIFVSAALHDNPIDVRYLLPINGRPYLDLSTSYLFGKIRGEPWPVERIVKSLVMQCQEEI
jgi:hypothetical protein